MSSTSENIDRHRRDLDNVFVYAAILEQGAEHVQATARMHFDYAVEQCRLHLDNHIPASDLPNGVTARFARMRAWSQPEVHSLWFAYLSGGCIDCNARVPFDESVLTRPDDGATSLQVLPLEAAIINGNTDCLRALLTAGADPTLVPSVDWSATPNTRTHGGPIVDIYTFIKAKIQKPEQSPSMSALVTECLMLRRLRSVGPAPVDSESVGRRRMRV